jgi:hypothetical protein
MPQYSWNNNHPADPAPYMPADLVDGDGRVVADVEEYKGHKVVGAVWCDTDTGLVRFMYKDMDFVHNYGRFPTFVMNYKPPLTVIPRGSAEPQPDHVVGG